MIDCRDTRKGRCNRCGKKLIGRQSSWCSRACARAFTAEHRWTQAKAKAKAEAAWFKCEYGPLVYADCLIFTQKPEVNHKEPCLGKHGTWGCHHHSANLECLCVPCHRKETKRQREAGLFDGEATGRQKRG